MSKQDLKIWECFTHATSILPSGLLVAPMTLVPSLNLRPCFCRMRWKLLDISMSMPMPPTWPRNSTAVTLEPRRCHTDPCRTEDKHLCDLRVAHTYRLKSWNSDRLLFIVNETWCCCPPRENWEKLKFMQMPSDAMWATTRWEPITLVLMPTEVVFYVTSGVGIASRADTRPQC